MAARKRGWIGLCLVALLLGLALRAEAFFVDEAGTLSISSKLQTRVAIRLQHAEENGFTYPQDTAVGDLVQWRNLALIEIDHDLNKLTQELGILWPLKKLDIQTKYHLVGRFMYEALYDVSGKFGQIEDEDPDNIDDFKQSYDLWEFYVDFSRGPAFVRIGRQILAWGETDIFRLLDGINPLDNTFGGPFEDLDDRRIPLWMLRGSYNLGTVGPFSSLTVDGFWVPGSWDSKVGPWPPFGTPYMIPDPEVSVYNRLYVNPPEKKMSNSRYGGRIQWLFGPDMNCSIAYYKSFLDLPTTYFVLTQPVQGPLLDFSLLRINADYPSVQVTGGSMTFWESFTNIVFRGEIAQFWDEPIFEISQNARPLLANYIPLPPVALDAVAVLAGEDPRSFGFNGVPVSPQSGNIAERNILRWMLGFDKQIWIRSLNKESMFFTSFQYFGQWVQDHQNDMIIPAAVPNQFVPNTVNSLTGEPVPSYLDFPHINEIESIFTAIINTNYMKGALTPQMAAAYDACGVWLLMPSINYIREPFRFGIQYAGIVGAYKSFGLFRDRDQIAFMVSYLMN